MLNHLRLEADAVEPHSSWIDLHACFNRHRTQYLPMAVQEGIGLRVARCRFKLYLDPALLDRAIGNLINNAIVHSGAHKILVGCRRAGASRVRIYVIDDGVGIGSADAKHVFQDFYRGSDSRARSNSGFGLGLSSVRRIADLMDGTAALDQRWIHGAAFYLEFPNSLSVSR
jgi:signal transduction histidine kinase